VEGDPRARRAARLRLAALALLLGAIFVVATLTDSLPDAERIRDRADGLGLAGPLVFVPASVALSCLFVPGPVLAASAGLLFGTAGGTAVALVAAVAGALVQMSISRRLAGDAALTLLPARARRIDELVEHNGFLAVLYVRLTPGLPYTLANYVAGLTSLRLREMAAGTALGAAPRTFAWVALGGSLGDLSAPEAKVAIGLLVVFGLAGLVLARRQLAAAGGAAP
jgi:uncharacterized membrane protein YdjX (TVP38/TMEM64 family)